MWRVGFVRLHVVWVVEFAGMWTLYRGFRTARDMRFPVATPISVTGTPGFAGGLIWCPDPEQYLLRNSDHATEVKSPVGIALFIHVKFRNWRYLYFYL